MPSAWQWGTSALRTLQHAHVGLVEGHPCIANAETLVGAGTEYSHTKQEARPTSES